MMNTANGISMPTMTSITPVRVSRRPICQMTMKIGMSSTVVGKACSTSMVARDEPRKRYWKREM